MTSTSVPQGPSQTSLSCAFERIRQEEARSLPDMVVPLNETSWTPTGLLNVPSLGETRVNQWARDQLAQIVGIQFDRWFLAATPEQQADEMTRRLKRARNKVRLRLAHGKDGPLLRAVVGPGYSAVEDSILLGAVGDSLSSMSPTVHRLDMTQRLTTLVIRFGEPQMPNAIVGDISGAITVTNSGVGWCKLSVVLSILRVVCSNGMRAPVHEALILGVRHRCLEPERIRAQLSSEMQAIPARLREAIRVLGASTTWPVVNVEAESRELLREAGMIRAHHKGVLAAFRREPHPSVFGLSQALTLYAQQTAPEDRIALEALAGNYVLRSAP